MPVGVNEQPGYSGGFGESLQTALPRGATAPTPSATNPQNGLGTDSGLASPLGPPVVPTVGAAGGSSSSGSTSPSDANMAMGTDSGLASPLR
jgi:hypothetical protein